MRVVFSRLGITSERGQGMVEYALILVLISIVSILLLLLMGNRIGNWFSNVTMALNG